MKHEYVKAKEKGDVLLNNRFATEKGEYQIVIHRYNSAIYLFKYRNGILLECQNLSKMNPKEDRSDG